MNDPTLIFKDFTTSMLRDLAVGDSIYVHKSDTSVDRRVKTSAARCGITVEQKTLIVVDPKTTQSVKILLIKRVKGDSNAPCTEIEQGTSSPAEGID